MYFFSGALAALCFLAVILALVIIKTAHNRSPVNMGNLCCTKASRSNVEVSAFSTNNHHNLHPQNQIGGVRFAALQQLDPEYPGAALGACAMVSLGVYL